MNGAEAKNQAFTAEILDLDIIGGRLIALEELNYNGTISYAITMSPLSGETPDSEYHDYYEYEVDLEDAMEHFKHALTYVGERVRGSLR